LASLTRPKHVVAFQQPFHLRFAAGQKAKEKGAMGDRFVAWRTDSSFKRSRALGAKRRRSGLMGMRGHLTFLTAGANSRAAERTALVSSALETVDHRPIWRIDRAGGDD
jgi:hypothetical protein